MSRVEHERQGEPRTSHRRIVGTRFDFATSARASRALAVGVVGLALLLLPPIARSAGTVDITTCLTPCHSAPGYIGPDVATTYIGDETNAGHAMSWNPRVVEDASGASLPQGARMPCDECHTLHGPETSSIYMFSTERTGGPVTTVRQLCEGCHRPSDSSRPAPVACGLVLKRLPSGVSDHAEDSSRPCSDCHGLTGHAPAAHGGDSDCGDAACHGGTGSHPVHLNATDPRGPGALACNACHDNADLPAFASGTDADEDGRISLSETDACDACHSPGGSYDGVESASAPSGAISVGAKDNWSSRVYATTSTLQPGKDRWCAGCHDGDVESEDDAPSVIGGVSAPAVAGDESALTDYGVGFGYYVTGHGRPAAPYPGTLAPPAAIGCEACHDLGASHIDGIARTYSAPSDNYQSGYRLVNVDGGAPLDIPRMDWNAPTSDFALCFAAGCHDSDIYLNSTNLTTNFRADVAEGEGINRHQDHSAYGGAWDSRWDSDWDGAGDSQANCPACHNVHGSPTPAMTRHGELTGKQPGLGFKYLPLTAEPHTTRPLSTGGRMDLSPGAGTVGSNGICGMCHNQLQEYSRVPNDFYPPRIMNVWGTEGSSFVGVGFTKGAYTSADASGAVSSTDFVFTDADNGRTIADVTHAEGEDHARLTLTSALDSVADIDVDALAAATEASIYDAGGLRMGTDQVIVRRDAALPGAQQLSPANGATGVARDAALSLTLEDGESGIAWGTFRIHLSGDSGYSKTYDPLDVGVVSRSGTHLALEVRVEPDTLFALGEVVTVTVEAEDLVGNELTAPAWTFTVEAEPTAHTVVVYPSGLGLNPGGYWTVPAADQWAAYLDDNDADADYATSNTGPAGAELHLEMDDPDLSGSTIQDVTIHAYARYVNGFSPNPPAYSGDMWLGDTMGGATRWTGNLHLDASGSYIHVSSPTYTTDPLGGAIDEADIAGLRVGFERRTSGAYPLRITQAYAVVTYVPGETASFSVLKASSNPTFSVLDCANDPDLDMHLLEASPAGTVGPAQDSGSAVLPSSPRAYPKSPPTPGIDARSLDPGASPAHLTGAASMPDHDNTPQHPSVPVAVSLISLLGLASRRVGVHLFG